MTNYYFLAASLPSLKIGERPELTFDELIARFEINLTEGDFQKTKKIRQMIDFFNIRTLLLKKPLDPRGNLTEKELDEALLTQTGLPDYLFEFLSRFDTDTSRIQNLNFLISAFLQDQIDHSEGFLKRYFTLERERRLVLTAIRAKALGRDVAKELSCEDPLDPFVADILAQKESPHYLPPKEYAELKDLYLSSGVDPWTHYIKFSQWRFERTGALAEGPLFSVDWVLAYLAQYLLVDTSARLDVVKGEEILRQIAEG